CDANPINLGDEAARERLAAYVWADQSERVRRIEAAIEIARAAPVAIDCAEAADWVEQQIEPVPARGSVRVLFHSVVWSYLSEGSRNRIRAHLSRAGAAASIEAPLAWLRYELADPPELRLRYGRPARRPCSREHIHMALGCDGWPEGSLNYCGENVSVRGILPRSRGTY